MIQNVASFNQTIDTDYKRNGLISRGKKLQTAPYELILLQYRKRDKQSAPSMFFSEPSTSQTLATVQDVINENNFGY